MAQTIHAEIVGGDRRVDERPGLRGALAACLAGDTLVVTKLDRLVRSLPDARAIADELTAWQIALSVGGSVYDPRGALFSSEQGLPVVTYLLRERVEAEEVVVDR